MAKADFELDRFQRDIKDHRMIILADDGQARRHVRFKRPDTTCMHFDLITWPGRLCYVGDMGTYVFCRLEDMFKFFRGQDDRIDYRYWAEKCEAADRSGITAFDEDIFKQGIKSYFREWLKDNYCRTTKEERRELWENIESFVLNADGDSGGYRKQIGAHDFLHTVNGHLNFSFHDFWETDCTSYTFHFLWCCHAIRWGIQQYDAQKAATIEATRRVLSGSIFLQRKPPFIAEPAKTLPQYEHTAP